MKCEGSNRGPEASPNEERYDPSGGESRLFPDIRFREAAIDQEAVPPGRPKHHSPSPTAKVFGDSEDHNDHDVAWVPKNLAKLLSAYAPSADSAIIDSVVLAATHMLQKHRDQECKGPIQHTLFSSANPTHVLTEEYGRGIMYNCARN